MEMEMDGGWRWRSRNGELGVTVPVLSLFNSFTPFTFSRRPESVGKCLGMHLGVSGKRFGIVSAFAGRRLAQWIIPSRVRRACLSQVCPNARVLVQLARRPADC